MNSLDELLETLGLTVDKMTGDEFADYERLSRDISGGKSVTVDDFKNLIKNLKYAAEQQLFLTDITDKKRERLMARLENYLLFESFLYYPERQKEKAEKEIAARIEKAKKRG